MKEIWNLAISPPMLPLTILLVPVAIYWLLSVIGAIDHDIFGVDLDGPDGCHDGGNHDHPVLDWLHGALRIVNAREVPLMIVLSVLILFLWGCSMLGNVWFNSDSTGWTGTIIVVSALAASLVLTRLSLAPLKPLFRLMQDDVEKSDPVPGRTGSVRTAFITEREGQVEVETRGAPFLLNARIPPGADPIPRGTPVLIVSQDPDSGLCLVRTLNEISH